MNVIALHRQGWTNKQIADALERHPATIAKWIEDGGPPPLREFSGERIIDEQWQGRVEQLLKANSDLLATSIHRIITAEGFTGSYPTVVRHVRAVRGSRREKNPQVSVTIETAPGEEGQADWSDCKDWGRAWDISDQLQCFGAILSWSRHRFWWFADSCNRPHTLEALVRFFEDAGGVPVTMKIDRMGALGRSTSRAFRLHPPALEFARYHGFAFRACRSGNARAKGKVERPFLELKDAFLAELEATGPPSSIGELNNKSALWLATHVHPRPHRVTGVPPATRLESEAKLLAPVAARALRHLVARAAPGRPPRAVGRARWRLLLGPARVRRVAGRGPLSGCDRARRDRRRGQGRRGPPPRSQGIRSGVDPPAPGRGRAPRPEPRRPVPPAPRRRARSRRSAPVVAPRRLRRRGSGPLPLRGSR